MSEQQTILERMAALLVERRLETLGMNALKISGFADAALAQASEERFQAERKASKKAIGQVLAELRTAADHVEALEARVKELEAKERMAELGIGPDGLGHQPSEPYDAR